jgi:transcriptional regulator with XRE-family HTH domain
MSNGYEIKNLGETLKQRRVMLMLTLQKLGDISGVSQSHLGRIERGEDSRQP